MCCGVESICCVHTTNNEDVLCGLENIFRVHTTNNEVYLCGVENVFTQLIMKMFCVE